jgi:predicted RNase H-like HicB family nuclease
MKTLKYVVYKEGKFYVSQCLNVDISSFGNSISEAIENLKEALELYFEDNDASRNVLNIEETLMGETYLNV